MDSQVPFDAATHVTEFLPTVNIAIAATQTPSPVYITVVDVVTSTLTQQVLATSTATLASLNIKAAIDDALAAVDLSQSGLTSEMTAALETCLSTVLATGGMPAGYTCITSSGSSSAGLKATLDTILQQVSPQFRLSPSHD